MAYGRLNRGKSRFRKIIIAPLVAMCDSLRCPVFIIYKKNKRFGKKSSNLFDAGGIRKEEVTKYPNRS